MGMLHTTPWDPADHLATEEDKAAYLEAALEEGEPALVAATLGDIVRAKGMSQVWREPPSRRWCLRWACDFT